MQRREAQERGGDHGAGEAGAADLRVLSRISEGLNAASSIEQALETTLALLSELLHLDTGWVWLLDPDSGAFYSAAVRNLPPYLVPAVRMTGEPCWCIEMFREGRLKPGNIRLVQCSRLLPAVRANDQAGTLGYSAHASLPLFAGETPVGILNLAAPAWREFTADELQLLETLAYQVGVALERVRLSETAARLAREEERLRLAREIHDTLAQGLTAIGLQLEGALGQLEENPDRARARVERALALVWENLEEARSTMQSLRGSPLAGRSLPEALGALARGFTAETGIRTHLQTGDPIYPETTPEVEAELFRIVQEALANVRRHSGATDASIVLAVREGTLRLEVRDNGSGFDTEAVPSGRHGLAGMRERARQAGGALQLHSEPGAGTRVTVEIPVSGPEHAGVHP